MRKRIIMWITGIGFMGLCATVVAETLPKSGKINIQSIYKGTTLTKYNDDYSHGTITGVTFNEAGTGTLHLAKTACSFSIFSREDINRSIGFCTIQDKDGDSIFIQYAGTSQSKGEWNGVDDIIGGTGKFKGIQGSGPYSCANTDKEGEFPCTAKFDYRLP